jgi:hypothetical protein
VTPKQLAQQVVEQWDQWERVGVYFRHRDPATLTPLVPVDEVLGRLLHEVAQWRHKAAAVQR